MTTSSAPTPSSTSTSTSTPPTTVLITGATKGIGLEAARRFAALGWTVWLGARDADRGRSAAADVTAAHPGTDVRPLLLDVTDDASVAAAYDVVAASGTGLDVLVNNAGILGTRAAPADVVPADFLPVFGVNLLGPVRVTHAFLPLLRRSAAPRLVMVSSGMGSFTVTSDPDHLESTVPGLAYPASKAALNMVTTRYATALPDVRVVAVDPGYSGTDFNGHSGPQTVAQGVEPIVTGAAADTLPGLFLGRDGALGW